MKLTVALLLFFSFQSLGDVAAQKIDIQVTDASLKAVLQDLSKQSGYAFIYKEQYLMNAKPVTVQIQDEPIGEVLEIIFKDQPFEYRIEGKVVTLKPKSPTDTASPQAERDKQHTIHGKVIDSAGVPLPGATVQVKDTRNGTFTDSQGEYEITGVSEDVILVFSLLGFQSQEIPVGGRSTLNVMLQVSMDALNQVTVVSTGYQQIPKERATGSFEQISNNLFNRQVSTDVISRLKNIASSLLFDERQGDHQKFSIRGRSTIMANDQPLIVVDNFPYDGDINNLNPNDIESITLLKDAAAASIWGVRAGNGVLVITTKKGKNNQPLQIQFNSNVTIGDKPDIFYDPNFLNSTNFIEVEKELFNEGYYDGALNNYYTYPIVSPVVEILNKQRLGELSTEKTNELLSALGNYDLRRDIEKYFYRNSIDQQYSVSLTGGSANAAYHFSAGYDKNLSTNVGNTSDRITLNSNSTYNLLGNVALSMGIMYTRSFREYAPSDYSTLKLGNKSVYPYARIADNQGNPLPIAYDYRLSFIESLSNSGLLDWRYYPLEEIDIADQTSTDNYLRITPSLSYSILPGLNVELRYQYEHTQGQNLNNRGLQSYFTRNLINNYSHIAEDGSIERPIPVGGILDKSNHDMSSQTFRSQISYSKSIGMRHDITAIAGYEAKELIVNSSSQRLYGYDENLGISTAFINYTESYPMFTIGSRTIPSSSGTLFSTLDRYQSYYTNASYTFDKRYTISGSARIDQSNLFGVATNQKKVPLWSAGLSWTISSEDFYNLAWLPYLKIRSTYGYSGNVDKRTTAFTTGVYTSDLYTGIDYLRITNPGNPELRWEKIGMWNLGVEFHAAQGTIDGSIEYYHKKGTDIIGNALIDPTTGILDSRGEPVLRGNFANIKGHGIDIHLNTLNIDRQVKWNTTFLFSHNRDKVTKYTAPTSASNYLNFGSGMSTDLNLIYPFLGKPVFSIFSYKWAGLDSQTGDPTGFNDMGERTNDYTVLTNIEPEQLIYNGPALPTTFGAVRNTLTLQNWSISLNVSFKAGYYFRRTSIRYSSLANNWTAHKDYKQRWQQPGDEKETDIPSMSSLPLNARRDNFYSNSEALVERGDHIRLRDIRLAYSLSRVKISKFLLRDIDFYFYANNLGILWRANRLKLDPDIVAGYPQPVHLSFGLSAKF